MFIRIGMWINPERCSIQQKGERSQPLAENPRVFDGRVSLWHARGWLGGIGDHRFARNGPGLDPGGGQRTGDENARRRLTHHVHGHDDVRVGLIVEGAQEAGTGGPG